MFYEKMYFLAEKLAMHETGLYMNRLLGNENPPLNEKTMSLWEAIWKKREERLQHHLNEMKELLRLYLKENKVISRSCMLKSYPSPRLVIYCFLNLKLLCVNSP